LIEQICRLCQTTCRVTAVTLQKDMSAYICGFPPRAAGVHDRKIPAAIALKRIIGLLRHSERNGDQKQRDDMESTDNSKQAQRLRASVGPAFGPPLVLVA
jgi:hypothetical protein